MTGPREFFIREWRERCGWSQEELAERVGVSQVSVSRWESGTRNPTLAKQRALAEAFGIQPIQLRAPPQRISLDALLADASDDERARAAEVLRAMFGLADKK